MTDDLLDRVRRNDPLPPGSSAPPFATVHEYVRGAGAGSHARGPARLVAPALIVASVIVVAVVSVVILAGHHRGALRPARKPTVRRSVPVVPRSGMSGLVYLFGAGFSAPQSGVISLQQCVGCREGNLTAQAISRYWLLTTADGGRTWRLHARRYYVQQPLFAGMDGWAGGLQATGDGGGGIARYYVTHDGGRSWSIAPAAAPNEGGALVSLGGGEAWAVGLSSKVTILHAPVGGGRLDATPTQPVQGSWTNVQVLAGGPGTAYVINDDAPRERFVTHDDGRTWQQMASPCASGQRATLLAAWGDTVWADCLSSVYRSLAVARSDDAGLHWRTFASPSADILSLQAVSARVAWGTTTVNGRVLRTADGAQTWQTVWSPADRRQAPIRAQVPRLGPWARVPGTPTLVAQSASAATVVVVITRGRRAGQARATNLALYQTTDAGRTWRPSVVPLATP